MYISRYIDIGTFLFLISVSKSEPKVCWSVSAALTGRTYSGLLDSTEGSSADEWTQVQLTVPTNRSDCELLVAVVINRKSRFNSQLKVVTTFVDKIVQLVPLSFTLWFRRAAGQGKYTFNILMIFNRTPFKSFNSFNFVSVFIWWKKCWISVFLAIDTFCTKFSCVLLLLLFFLHWTVTEGPVSDSVLTSNHKLHSYKSKSFVLKYDFGHSNK